MIKNVPPGGNWKSIPLTVPSKRLEQIRESCAAGGGSRSTYYGRLKAADPAFTVTTYFNRPGNGCFTHYDYAGDQHRLISHREAARLQSFPDSFVFTGSKGSICKQIGNAVPPLLAYQIAKSFPESGQFIDLFCGAGGLSLGFQWAGWKGLVSNDVDATFLKTHHANVGTTIVEGDIANLEVRDEIIDIAKSRLAPGIPTLIIGGPPCQGFSTAGNARSMDDARNHLFKSYAQVLSALKPTHFVFENVPGLLSMSGGAVLAEIRKTLESAGYQINLWKLNAENYGVPQRRQRIFLIGSKHGVEPIVVPAAITRFKQKTIEEGALPLICGAEDSLGDLAAIQEGEDGSHLPYRSPASSPFQKFSRGDISPELYLHQLRN